MTSPRQAATYGILGGAAGFVAFWQFFNDAGKWPELWLIMLWPCLSLLTMAFWYAYDSQAGIAILNKNQRTGQIPGGTMILMAPYFFVANGWWLVRHKLVLQWVENPYDKVASDGQGDIYVGRWPLYYPSQFPTTATGVVDVTAEWWARDCVTRGRNYLCLPSLDCDMPDTMAMLRGARKVAREWNGGLYVHCANGHGRSSCFAALVMLFRRQASSWREAFKMMRTHRQYIHIQAPQERIMEKLEAIILKELAEDAARAEEAGGAKPADADAAAAEVKTAEGAATATPAGVGIELTAAGETGAASS